jgi:hypothetical protein
LLSAPSCGFRLKYNGDILKSLDATVKKKALSDAFSGIERFSQKIRLERKHLSMFSMMICDFVHLAFLKGFVLEWIDEQTA